MSWSHNSSATLAGNIAFLQAAVINALTLSSTSSSSSFHSYADSSRYPQILLMSHLRVVAGALHLEQLSANQRSQVQTAVTRVGEGLDWPTAAKRDLEAFRADYAANSQTSAALTRIISSYAAALSDESKLPALNQAVESSPQEFANVIPNARRVLEQK